jgi:hypothetical protein
MILKELGTMIFSAEAHMHAPRTRRTIRLTVPPQDIKNRLRMVYSRPGLLRFVPILGSFVAQLLQGLYDLLLL